MALSSSQFIAQFDYPGDPNPPDPNVATYAYVMVGNFLGDALGKPATTQARCGRSMPA